MEEINEEVALNLAMVQTEEMFSNRVRAEVIYLINKDEQFRKEVDRLVERRMRAYKRQLAATIADSLDGLIYATDDQKETVKAPNPYDRQRQELMNLMQAHNKGQGAGQ
jgi:histidinol dehydrogenase